MDPSMYMMNQQFYMPQQMQQNINQMPNNNVNHQQQMNQHQQMQLQQMQQQQMMQNQNNNHNHKMDSKKENKQAAANVKKPKGRMSSYTYFVQTCREEHRKKHPTESVNFTEFSKKCGERWKQMTDKEKKRFAEMADKDKVRYDREMSTYTPPAGEGGGRKRRKKDPNAPKRPLSAFFLFCHDERPSVRAIYPTYGVGEVAKELGDRWGKILPENKLKYEAKAQVDKGRYEIDMATYKNKGKVPPVTQEVEEEEDDDDDEEDNE